MDLSQIEDFLELARTLNFSRAAEGRNMTQPAFSRRIRALEDAIGTPLTQRTTRSVTLTQAGRAFLPRAEALVRMAQDARTEALAAAGLAQKTLTLAATHALSYTFVPRWLMGISGAATAGTLNLVSDSFQSCLQLMARGEAQFFISHRGLGEAPEALQAFRTITIGQDILLPLCAPAKDGKPMWRPGPDAPLLAYAPASGLHAILQGVAGQVRMRSVLAASNLELAKSGQGIAWLPLTLAQDALDSGALVRASDSDQVPVDIVLHRPRARLSAHCEAVWDRATNA